MDNLIRLTGRIDSTNAAELEHNIFARLSENGTVYRIDEETILKVYNTAAPELIYSERIMSQRAFVNGLPTAIPYDVVKVGDKLGVVYEMLEAKTVAQLITADPSRLEEYVRLTTSNLKRFHSVEIHDKAFPNKKQLFYDMLESITSLM